MHGSSFAGFMYSREPMFTEWAHTERVGILHAFGKLIASINGSLRENQQSVGTSTRDIARVHGKLAWCQGVLMNIAMPLPFPAEHRYILRKIFPHGG
jgi:hypothetical protein